jgi:type I restriction enzyme, S subunit
VEAGFFYRTQSIAFVTEKANYVACAKVSAFLFVGFSDQAPEEQGRIVAIFNQVDALVNNVTSGLPVEMAVGRLTYQHDQDRLLSLQASTPFC